MRGKARQEQRATAAESRCGCPARSHMHSSTAHVRDISARVRKRRCGRCRASQDQYKALGEHVHAVQANVMAEQLATFKRSLEEFAIKHRSGLVAQSAALMSVV